MRNKNKNVKKKKGVGALYEKFNAVNLKAYYLIMKWYCFYGELRTYK